VLGKAKLYISRSTGVGEREISKIHLKAAGNKNYKITPTAISSL